MSAVSVPFRNGPRPAARPPLRLVEDVANPRRVPWLLLLAVLFVGAVLAALTLTALAAEDAVLARELEAEVTTAERDYAQLVAEVASLESPARIAHLAEEIGLVRESVPRPLLVDRPLRSDRVVDDEPLLADGDGLKPLLTEER